MRSENERTCDLGLFVERIAQPANAFQISQLFVGYLGFCARIAMIRCTFLKTTEREICERQETPYRGPLQQNCGKEKETAAKTNGVGESAALIGGLRQLKTCAFHQFTATNQPGALTTAPFALGDRHTRVRGV